MFDAKISSIRGKLSSFKIETKLSTVYQCSFNFSRFLCFFNQCFSHFHSSFVNYFSSSGSLTSSNFTQYS